MQKRCGRKIIVLTALCVFLSIVMANHVMAETVSENEVKTETVSHETSNSETEIMFSGMKGELEWTIDEDGLLTITGKMDPYWGHYSGWLDYKDYIIAAKVSVVGTEDLMNRMFVGCEKLEKIDFTGTDTSTVTDISNMFCDCYNLKTIDLSVFNTENVTDMYGLFWNCNSLEEINWGTNFKTSKVTNMAHMFDGCNSLEELDLTFFDTKSVEKMNSMFSYCIALKTLNVSTINTKNVTDMTAMFWYCKNLGYIDVTGFDTSKVTSMRGMFSYCGFEELDITNFDTNSLTNMWGMFENCKNLKKVDLSKFNTEKVTNISRLFSGCTNLESVDLSSFKTHNVTNMSYMFNGCVKIQYINMKKFDVTLVTDINYNVFGGCNSLQTLVAPENKSYGTLMLPKSDGYIWIYEPTGKKVWDVTSAGTYVKIEEGETETTVTKKVEAVGTKLSSEKLTTISGEIPLNSTFTVTSSDSKNPTVSFDGVKEEDVAAVSIPTTIIYNGVTYKVTSVSITLFTSTKDKAKYKVVGNGIGSLKVEYKSPTSKTQKAIKISGYTVYKGIKFKVTSVASKAFKNNKKLKTVTIGKNVQKIGKSTFYGCKKLKTIKINSKVLKSVGKNALKGVNKDCKIKVPKTKLKIYKKLFKKKGQAKTVKIVK